LQESCEKLRQILGLNWEVSKIGPMVYKFADDTKVLAQVESDAAREKITRSQ